MSPKAHAARFRTRAEVRGTAVYAGAKLPSLETSKVFLLNKHRRCLLGNIAGVSAASRHSSYWGSHGRNLHAMSVAIVLKC